LLAYGELKLSAKCGLAQIAKQVRQTTAVDYPALVSYGGWRLAAGGWRLAAGGWRLAAGAFACLLRNFY
jgi:hypothetical protein